MQHKHKNIKFGTMVDYFKRYQVGLTLNNLYPIISGKCACGCNKDLPKNMKKWYSDTCREWLLKQMFKDLFLIKYLYELAPDGEYDETIIKAKKKIFITLKKKIKL